jgi:toxin ParE1/3/4
VKKPAWRVHLIIDAQRDFQTILAYTVETFGVRQARRYEALLIKAILRLHQGPNIAGSIARDDIRPHLRSLPLVPSSRSRHFILYRRQNGVIEVLRILHVAMDFSRHIPKD